MASILHHPWTQRPNSGEAPAPHAASVYVKQTVKEFKMDISIKATLPDDTVVFDGTIMDQDDFGSGVCWSSALEDALSSVPEGTEEIMIVARIKSEKVQTDAAPPTPVPPNTDDHDGEEGEDEEDTPFEDKDDPATKNYDEATGDYKAPTGAQ